MESMLTLVKLEQEIICFSICDPTNDSIIRIVKNALLIYDFTTKSISIIK